MPKNVEVLSEIALTIMSAEDFASQMNSVLAIIGRFTGVSRAYIFTDDPAGTTTSNRFEWCDTGIAPQIDALQNLPNALFPSWRAILLREGRIYSEDIHQLPVDLVAMLEPQGILSIIAYPLFIENQYQGFVGFDECRRNRRWKATDLNLLKTVSGFISTAYDRRVFHERLKRSEQNFQTFFNTIDDMVFIGDFEGAIVHANDAVVRKLGYTLEELRKMKIQDLHPPSRRSEAGEILRGMLLRERDECPLELADREGRVIPVQTRVWFGRWDDRECLFGLSKDLTREQEALQMFTKLFENNPALMAISSLPDRRFSDVNRAFLEHLGFQRNEVIGKTAAEIGLFPEPAKARLVAEHFLNKSNIRERPVQVRRKDGVVVEGLFSGEIIESQGKQCLLTVMVDVTEQTRLRERINDQRQRLDNIIVGTNLGTWEWNVQTGETIYNERWAEIIGYTLAELQPVSINTWIALAHPDDLRESEQRLKDHFQGKTSYYELECRMKHKDGRWMWVHDRGKVIHWTADGKPLTMFGTHTDITAKKELEERITELSIRDPLTNAFNRRYLFERFESLLAEYRREKDPFSLALLDIDHFKQLNDRHGHLAGDLVLKELTGIISRQLRPYDILGRYGGEEFIVVLLHTTQHQAARKMEAILADVRSTELRFEDLAIGFTFSCGVTDCSEFPTAGLTAEKLIGRADARLYQAKETGRARVIAGEEPPTG